jgi:hypothetical protein
MSWKILSKKTAFANRWRTIEEWKMQTHTNDVYDFYITQEQDVIMVAGLTSDKKSFDHPAILFCSSTKISYLCSWNS